MGREMRQGSVGHAGRQIWGKVNPIERFFMVNKVLSSRNTCESEFDREEKDRRVLAYTEHSYFNYLKRPKD